MTNTPSIATYNHNTNGLKKHNDSDIHESVSNYYGNILSNTNDLRTTACCTTNKPSQHLLHMLNNIPSEVLDKYYGCGLPPLDGLDGLDILDLGCGSGRDCYILSSLVGDTGSVTGVDMTDNQLDVAKRYADKYCIDTLGYSKCNMMFEKQYIETLDYYNQYDLITSNCVINLSPNKHAVLHGVYNALRHGGEFYFSDVYSDRRIPEHLKTHPILLGECLGGALYINDFIRLASSVGFIDCRIVDSKPIQITDLELSQLIGNIKFTSITYRLFKFDSTSIDQLESLCEDYGQIGVYNGTITNNPHSYKLDDHHIFYTNKPMLVCGNTASMIHKSITLGKHFTVIGNRDIHYGLFPCGTAQNVDARFDDVLPSQNNGACC